MRSTAREKTLKQTRKATSAGSDGEDYPPCKRPRLSPDISPSAFSEDEENEKYAQDLVSIGEAIEDLQSRERKFHLEWQRRLEEFHQSQQDKYDGLKRSIHGLERRWSNERIKRIKQKTRGEGSTDMSSGSFSSSSVPPITKKPSSLPKAKDNRNLGVVRNLYNSGSETGEEEEDSASYIVQPTTQRKQGQMDRWTPNSSISVLHNDPPDSGDKEDSGIREVFSNARPPHNEKPRSTGLLNEEGYVEGMESLGSGTQAGQPPNALSPSQDQPQTSPVRRANSPPYAYTNSPRHGRSRPNYKMHWPIDTHDDPPPPPATYEDDDDFTLSQLAPPTKLIKKKKANARGGGNKTPKPSPEKVISKPERTTKKGDIGTPSKPNYGTAQQKLSQFFEKSPSKQLGDSDYRATPTPGGPVQATQVPRSPHPALDDQSERQIKVRSALSPPILGGTLHTNKTPKKVDQSIQNFRAVRSPLS